MPPDPADPARPADDPPLLPPPRVPAGATEGVPVGELVELTPARAVARAALNRARAAAAARGLRPGDPVRRSPFGRGEIGGPGGTAGPGPRDPQLLGSTLGRLLDQQGWRPDVLVGGVVGRWAEIVGPEVAAHVTIEQFEGGELVLRTDSTAWATQMRLLTPSLLGQLADQVGEGVVATVRVLGPVGPGFGRGPRRVRGRGPRDTWG